MKVVRSDSGLYYRSTPITHQVVGDDGIVIASGTSLEDAVAAASVVLVDRFDKKVARAKANYESLRRERMNDVGRQLIVDWLNEQEEATDAREG